MTILVGGTVALDTIETTHSKVEKVLGGSASYFAYAAGFNTSVSLVGVVGPDFPQKYKDVLTNQRIDLSGLEVSRHPTFSWHGRYHEDSNQRDTLEVNLAIFEDYCVKVPEHLRNPSILCLANMSPENQLQLLEACQQPRFVLMDTMDLWIETARADLLNLLRKVNLLILNDSEARMLSEKDNLIQAGRHLLSLGPEYVCIKKGENGVALFHLDDYFVLGAYPLESVLDPTGAGDCFAGGLASYLDQVKDINFASIKEALLTATVAASFCVEDFSLKRLQEIDLNNFRRRQNKFINYISLKQAQHA